MKQTTTLQSPKAMSYREEIDGLRAIAVLSVIIFHFFPKYLPGGYIGVDVFFTISGYIITSTTLHRLKNGDCSIISFYIRRISRLIPSLSLVIIVSTLFFASLYTTHDFNSLINSALASNFYISNWHFLTETGYFDDSSYLKPLLHTWSLSIEEQFYIIFPLLLIPLVTRKKIKIFTYLISAITIISLMYALSFTHSPPEDTLYFSTITRAWQIGIGVLAALYLQNKSLSLNPLYKNLSFIIAFIAYTYSIYTFTPDYKIPGLYSFLPLLLPLHIIFFCQNKKEWYAKILATTPFTFLGKISYQLYLWHWPAIVTIGALSLDSEKNKILALPIILLISWLTYALFNKSRKKDLFYLSLILVSVITIGITGYKSTPSLELSRSNDLFGKNATTIASVENQKKEYTDTMEKLSFPSSKSRKSYCSHDHLLIERNDFENCFSQNKEKDNVLIIGDSNGREMWYALTKSFHEKNFILYHQSSCAPGSYNDCFIQLEEVLKTANKTMDFKHIILAFRYFPDHWENFINNIPTMKKMKKNVISLGVSPILNAHFHRHLGRLGTRYGESMIVPDTFPNDGTGLGYWNTRKIAEKAKTMSIKAGATFIDISDFYCLEGNCRLWISREYNKAMYWDSSHLTLEALEELSSYLKTTELNNLLNGNF